MNIEFLIILDDYKLSANEKIEEIIKIIFPEDKYENLQEALKNELGNVLNTNSYSKHILASKLTLIDTALNDNITNPLDILFYIKLISLIKLEDEVLSLYFTEIERYYLYKNFSSLSLVSIKDFNIDNSVFRIDDLKLDEIDNIKTKYLNKDKHNKTYQWFINKTVDRLIRNLNIIKEKGE